MIQLHRRFLQVLILNPFQSVHLRLIIADHRHPPDFVRNKVTMDNHHKHNIVGKQPNSRLCFICGLKNPAGLKASFYDRQDGGVIARFVGQEEHQGYPGRFHGGILAALLDEAMGRTVAWGSQDVWGVTRQITIKYHKPVPLGAPVEAICSLGKTRGRLYEAHGQVYLPDGTVAVESTGTYWKLSLAEIGVFDPAQEEWRVTPDQAQ